MSANRINDFAERLDRIEEDRQAAMADAREVYKEAKGEGYNVKALRRVLTELRRKTDAAYEADLEMYRALLGVPGATYRSVAEQLGVSKTKLQRLVPRSVSGTAESSGQPGLSALTADDQPEVASSPLDTPNAPTSDTGAGDGTGTDVPSIPAPAVADDLDIPPFLRRVRA